MLGDPYSAAWLRRRRHQARVEGGAAIGRALLPLVAALLLVPLVRPVFLSFLDEGAEAWADGLHAVSLRAGFVMVGWLALDLYTAIVRGPDRAVLAILPVDAAHVVRAEVVRVAVERWWLPGGAAIVLAPMAIEGNPSLWALAMAVIAAAWAMGLCASAMVHLLAIEVAESERWALVLDMLRGSNPRPQAAFIYAPGAVLGLAGILVALAASGARALYGGQTLGLLWLVLPWVAALVAWQPVGALSRRAWFQGSAVLAEIDARYAMLEDPREGLRVYLDWAVRFLPASVGLYALKDLRHGWRARRTLIMGAWAVGLLAFGAGWTESTVGVQRAAVVVVFGTFLCVGVGTLMARDDPDFLVAWLPPGGVARWVARALVLTVWSAPCTALAAVSVAMRQGLAEAAWIFGVGLVSVLVAVPVAVGSGRWLRARAPAVYGPVATVLAAGLALAVGSL